MRIQLLKLGVVLVLAFALGLAVGFGSPTEVLASECSPCAYMQQCVHWLPPDGNCIDGYMQVWSGTDNCNCCGILLQQCCGLCP